MKKYTSILLSFLICLHFINANAQDKLQKTIPELTVTNPETASLGKYGSFPMNLYTGTANISVPLYKLNFDGLKVPIDLSYNTGGIRSTQEATRIGLGWTLSCEPVITTQIKGGCDISVPFGKGIGYVYTDFPFPTYGDGNQSGWNMTDKLPAAFNLYYDRDLQQSGLDTEPDIFTLNVFGESVSFILTQKALNKGVIGVKMINGDKRYKIEYIEKDQTFLVTNDRGFKFYFTEKEYSIAAIYRPTEGYAVLSETNNKLITGWRLNKVVSPRNKVLSFKYSRSVIHGHPIETNYKLSVPWGFPVASGFFFNDNFGNSSSYNGYVVNYLDSMISDDATVEFTGSQRLDIAEEGEVPYEKSNMSNFIGVSANKPKKVDNIIVKNSTGDIIVNYKLNYSYFNQDQINDKFAKRKLRLKLDRIDLNNTYYRGFSYINPNQLPDKSQRTDDFWGFYNGDTHSFLSFPTLSYSYTEINGFKYRRRVVGGNRKPNFEFGKNGLLETVTYPTKGYTKLVYEANDIKIDKSNTEKFELYELVEPQKMAFVESLDSISTLSNVFEIKNTAGAEISLNIVFGMGGYYDYTSPGYSNVKYTVEKKDMHRVAYQIIDITTGQSVLNGYYTFDTEKISETPLGPASGLNWNKISKRVNLSKGKYRINATGLRHISNLFSENEGATSQHPDYYKMYKCSVKVDASMHPLADVATINLKVGGVRVKSIENYDNNNASLTKKEYKYSMEDGSASSGILIDDISFFNTQAIPYKNSPNLEGLSQHAMTIHIYSNSILKSPSSNHIGYSRVEEINTDSKNASVNNGKTISQFINRPNKYSFILDFPLNMIFTRPVEYEYEVYTAGDRAMVPIYSYQDINGKLIKEEHYNNSNVKVKESIFEYDYNYYDMPNIAHPNTIGTGLAQYFKKSYAVGAEGPISSDIYTLQIYKIISENTSLVARTDTEYNNGLSFSKKTTYTYNNQFQPKKITESSSDPTKSIETEMFYPTDLATLEQTTLLQQLVKDNIIFEPVSFKMKVGTTQTLNNHIKYKETPVTYKEGTQTMTKNLILPDIKYERTTGEIVLGASDPANRTIKYDKYDLQGKLVQFTALDQAPITYLWGYGRQCPIAKIENATYEQLKTILSESLINRVADSLIPSSADMLAINNLRKNTSLPDALITTYTYKPLVGILTATDPREVTTYFLYDSFNRLKETYIIEGGVKKTIQTNDYHYQN